MYTDLNERERTLLQTWKASKPVQKLLKNGAQLALLFTQTGIGVHTEAKVRDRDGNELSIDLTDYGSW